MMALRADKDRFRRAFTIVELLVVIAVIGVLVGLLLPAVQAARETARRSVCQSNLKELALAALNYEVARQAFPVGARSDGSPKTTKASYGFSWFVGLLPYLEQQAIYARLDRKGPNSGLPLLNSANGKAVHEIVLPIFRCPSSPLSPTWRVGSFQVMTPSYVGISGASNDDGFDEPRVNVCCYSLVDGQISGGGVLIANRAVAPAEITDGLSITLLAGEASEFVFDANGFEQRIDGAFPNGWLAGTGMRGTPPQYEATVITPSWNVTTLRYRVNTTDYSLPGIANDRGPNNPLVSAHVDGVNAVMTDGSIRYLLNPTDVLLLKRLATRDDGELAAEP